MSKRKVKEPQGDNVAMVLLQSKRTIYFGTKMSRHAINATDWATLYIFVVRQRTTTKRMQIILNNTMIYLQRNIEHICIS